MNPLDAVPSAARMLCADGAAAVGAALSAAIFDHNQPKTQEGEGAGKKRFRLKLIASSAAAARLALAAGNSCQVSADTREQVRFSAAALLDMPGVDAIVSWRA